MHDLTQNSSADSPALEVGLIGLGLLGIALAERLLARGFRVAGCDLDSERGRVLVSLATGAGRDGAARATGAADVLAGCDRVILCLPSHREVREVIEAHASALPEGLVILDTTTGDPASSAAFARELAVRSVSYLDATVSGSSEQLRAGDAVMMVGGEPDAMERCRDLLAALARESFHTGASGTGAQMKLVTNLVLGLNRAALAEGLVFAERLGLDPAATLRVLLASAAYSRIMDSKGLKMVGRDFTPQARLSQHLKDVGLIRAAAAKLGLELPLSTAHQELLERAERLGLGDLDNSALIEALRGDARAS